MLNEKQAAGLLNKLTAWYFNNNINKSIRRDALPFQKESQGGPNHSSDMWAKLMTDALVAFSEGLDDQIEPDNRRASYDAAVEMVGSEAFSTIAFIVSAAGTQLPLSKTAVECPSCSGLTYGHGAGGTSNIFDYDPESTLSVSQEGHPEEQDDPDPLEDEPSGEFLGEEERSAYEEEGEEFDEPTDTSHITHESPRGIDIEESREEEEARKYEEKKIKEENEIRARIGLPQIDELEEKEPQYTASPPATSETGYHSPCETCEGVGFIEEEEARKLKEHMKKEESSKETNILREKEGLDPIIESEDTGSTIEKDVADVELSRSDKADRDKILEFIRKRKSN